MSKDEKYLLTAAVLFATLVITPFAGWNMLVFSAAIIACIAFAKTKD